MALVTMVIDHVGRVLLPEVSALRLIGRLCFPVIAALLVQGFLHTRSRGRYGLRLLLLAVLAQGPFLWCFGAVWVSIWLEPILTLHLTGLAPLISAAPIALPELDICFLLALSVAALWAFTTRRWAVLVLAVVVAFLGRIEYGLYGLCTVFLFYVHDTGRIGRWTLAFLFTGLSVGVAALLHQWNQAFAATALVPILWMPTRVRAPVRLPKLVYYLSYPLHLLVLGGLARL